MQPVFELLGPDLIGGSHLLAVLLTRQLRQRLVVRLDDAVEHRQVGLVPLGGEPRGLDQVARHAAHRRDDHHDAGVACSQRHDLTHVLDALCRAERSAAELQYVQR